MDETDGNQAGLTDFAGDSEADGSSDDRDTAAEAAAVAGNGGDGAEIRDLSDVRYPDADSEVTFAVTQVDYTIEGHGDDEFPVIHVFGRTPEDNDPVHVEVYEFRPYFYAPTDSLDVPPEEEYDAVLESRETDENGATLHGSDRSSARRPSFCGKFQKGALRYTG
jgi:DNA polymerase I